MTLEQEINKWNSLYRYDFWWRKKYNVAYGSKEHRAANQVDICFEYLESRMYEKALEKHKESEKKKKAYKETGMWIAEGKNVSTNAFWDKLDLDKLKNL